MKCLNLKDVLFVDSGDPWNPQPATVKKVMAMLEGVHRVLKPGGTFISISFGQVCVLIYFLSVFFFFLSCPLFLLMFFRRTKFTFSTATFQASTV